MSMSSASYSRPLPLSEALWDRPSVIHSVVQWLGISGDDPGTGGRPRRTFLYSLGIAAAIVATTNAVNIVSDLGMRSDGSLFHSVVEEGTSWITFMLFFWIVWLGWRLAPPRACPHWKLLLHLPGALAFCIAHVGGFLLLRVLVYHLAGLTYHYGPLLTRFLYESRKDALGYALFVAGITLVDHLLRQQSMSTPPAGPATFDIRDGAKLRRVKLEDVVAITSGGNYSEFLLQDGQRLLMRSALSALESKLAPRGFLRIHRYWLINIRQVTAIIPARSGDYSVELGSVTVPLSRRFPNALAELRRGEALLPE
jgi:hypothetical protein